MSNEDRWLRIGRAFDQLEQCPPDHLTDFWRGYAAGWNAAQRWVLERALRDATDSDAAAPDPNQPALFEDTAPGQEPAAVNPLLAGRVTTGASYEYPTIDLPAQEG